MNCAEKIIRANNLQFIHQVTIEIMFRNPWRKRDLSPTWNLESNHSIVYKILKMFCEVYDTDSLV